MSSSVMNDGAQPARRAQTPNPTSTNNQFASPTNRAAHSTLNTTAAGRDGDVSAATVARLPQQQIDQAVLRLSQQQRPATVLGPLNRSKLLPPMALNQSIDRLYTQTLQTKQAKHQALSNKLLVNRRPQKILTQEDVDESVARLYNSTVKAKAQKKEMMKRKFLANYEKKPDEHAAEKVAHSIEFLYEEEKKRRAERRQKLLDKYITPTGPKVMKTDSDTIKSIADRLSQPKGGS